MVNMNGLNRTGRCGPQDPLTLGVVWVEVVQQCFLAVHGEDVGRQESALAVPLTPREVNDSSQRTPPSGKRIEMRRPCA
jgi:hypothetical protein